MLDRYELQVNYDKTSIFDFEEYTKNNNLVNKKDLEDKVKSFSAVVYFRIFLCNNSHNQKVKLEIRIFVLFVVKIYTISRVRVHARMFVPDKHTPKCQLE